MKKLFKYWRYRICRSIYYADQCPVENRKNYKKAILNALVTVVFCFLFTFLFILLFLFS